MKKSFISLVICAALCAAVFAQSESNFSTDGNGTITDYQGNSAGIIIPSQINGVTITSIGEAAFYDNRLTKITIPGNIDITDEPYYTFPNNFKTYYDNNGRKAGTYTYNGGWSFY